MIDGVVIKNLVVHQDVPDAEQPEVARGFLLEILRADDVFFKKFGQSIMTVAYPGTIKGFHWHERQDDLWFVATGKVAVILYDQRPASPTHKQTEVIHAGQDDYKLIVIPAGVIHAYKVISREPALLFYHTTEPYSPENPDERRWPLDTPEIKIDWQSL